MPVQPPVSGTRMQAAHPGAETLTTHSMAAPVILILSLLFQHPVSRPFWHRPLTPLCCWSSAQVSGSGAKSAFPLGCGKTLALIESTIFLPNVQAIGLSIL